MKWEMRTVEKAKTDLMMGVDWCQRQVEAEKDNISRLLSDGYEPFAVDNWCIYFKRQVTE